MKKKVILLLFGMSLSVVPCTVLAYSDQILIGGDNIGIHIDSNGVLVIGFYKINGSNHKGSPEIEIGDVIKKVDNKTISSINELTKAIEDTMENKTIKLTLMRNNKEFTSDLVLNYQDGVYKTGLYVKDGISGIGTLTYIDPGTKIFGTLGHEILESNSNTRIEVKTGSIFDSDVSKIIKSENGKVGEKNAKLNYSDVLGTIKKNTLVGVYGDYTAELPNGTLYDVAKKSEVKVGKATIFTVLSSNEIKEYEINITSINEYNEIKNISFEITDEALLKEAGGVIQGMSGSPIIQNNKVIGAVTHAIVDHVHTGYGVFITTMLEEGER